MTEVQAAGSKYKIGEGSFGKVYRYKYDNQEYAVKKVHLPSNRYTRILRTIQNWLRSWKLRVELCRKCRIIGMWLVFWVR